MNREEIKTQLEINKAERKQLKQQLKDLPVLEVGKWYVYRDKYGQDSIAFYNGNNNETYGFNCSGEFQDKAYWFSSWSGVSENDWIPATDKEVETALIKEAKKRGFKEGVDFESDGEVWTLKGNIDFKYRNNILNMWSDTSETKADGYISEGKGFEPIFMEGKWAEIIEPKTIHLNGDYTIEDLESKIKELK